jgi:hypothetical protein
MDSSKLLDDISKIREEFYSSRRKNIFFSSSQKTECADFVTSKLSLEELIHNTITIISNRIIYVDYSLFKQYASPANYEQIIKRLFDCIHTVMGNGEDGTFHPFELHIHLATFSISAAERYKDFIQWFYRIYFQSELDYGNCMAAMHIYYVPSMMNTISTILKTYMTESMSRRAAIRNKIFMYNKEESSIKLTELFGSQRA